MLEHFIRDLNARGASVIFLSVNDQLKAFPFIAGAVDRLQKEGFLRARDAADWLSGAKGYSSPEGHLWGTEAHRIIGEGLAEIVRAELAIGSPSSGKP
ncbi:MAG: hypothetical protein DMH00_07035 [Acidobacteria bacterium]|nr:MAG: hypothetical protein DMH00_07035 [Acidobacteriota bacterium]